MAIIIKKITKKTLFSATAFLGLLSVLFLKLLLGGNQINFSRAESAINPVAHADTIDNSGCPPGDPACGAPRGDGASGGSGDGDSG